MKKYIKDKKVYWYTFVIGAMLTTIVLTATLYIPGLLSNKVDIISALLMLTFVITISLFYGLFGLISSLSIALFFTLMLVFFKFLEINFTWSVYSALILGVILAINNCFLLLERTRVNLQNNWGLKKSFETARVNAFNINLDKNVIVFIVASIIFLINSNEISTIGAVLVIASVLSFIIITLINQNLIRIFISFKFKKNYKLLLGLSNKFKIWKNNNFLNKTKYIKYGMWGISGIGILLIIIFAPIDASGTDLFQSSVVKDMNKNIIINGILTMAAAMGAIFIYTAIRYRWNFALTILITLCQDLILLLALFTIMRLTINPLFIASSLVLLIYSTSFSINSFKDFKDRVETHVGEINKDVLYHNINAAMKKNILRVSLIFCFIVISLLVISSVGNWDVFSIGTLLGFVITILSSKLITPIIWTKLELFRLKQVEKRVKNNFWKTHGKEEEIINGINDYKV